MHLFGCSGEKYTLLLRGEIYLYNAGITVFLSTSYFGHLLYADTFVHEDSIFKTSK